MKRNLFVLCLLALCLSAFGVESKTHRFPADVSSYTGSTVATMTDGTVYTCSNGAMFYSDYGTIRLKCPNNGEVVMSPAISGLNEFEVHHSGGNISLNLYVSSNGSTWTQVTGSDLVQNSGYLKATNLDGDYYVKVKNVSAGNINITQMVYYYSTESCNCFRVVTE